MRLKTKISIFSASLLVILFLCGITFYHSLQVNPYLIFGGCSIIFVGLMFIYVGKLTSPLNTAINQLKQFNLEEDNIEFNNCSTKEINELNEELKTFSSLNSEQYLSQRQYSENLSHELLTPLAVIRTKAELILQSPQLRESDMVNLDGILQTVRRLSRVNQALILLSKISNNQFVDEEEIVVKDLITQSLANFEDQIKKKQIVVSVDLLDNEIIESNLNLLSILIVNLVKNAVFHNVEKGTINISLKNSVLSITNTGLKNNKAPEDFFNRFVSNKKSNDSIGLGLAIVKQICTLFNYQVNYESEGVMHKITVSFIS